MIKKPNRYPRQHKVILTITFNKGTKRRLAVREARNCIHGTFYCDVLNDGEPDSFTIQSINARAK